MNADAAVYVPMTPPRSDCGAGDGGNLQEEELQWYTDFDVPDFTTCRGEREGVLGQRTHRDWIQWSLDTGTPLTGADPSEKKTCRLDNGGGIWGYLFPDEVQLDASITSRWHDQSGGSKQSRLFLLPW